MDESIWQYLAQEGLAMALVWCTIILIENIKYIREENGIEMPFPHRILHILTIRKDNQICCDFYLLYSGQRISPK